MNPGDAEYLYEKYRRNNKYDASVIAQLEAALKDGAIVAEENILLRQENDTLRLLPSVENCQEGRANGRGGCGACALCCKENRDRVEAAEAQRDALLTKVAAMRVAGNALADASISLDAIEAWRAASQDGSG